MPTETETNEGRVISLLAGVWDHALSLAAADGVPEQDRGGIAARVLAVFLDGVRDKISNGKLAQACGVAYLAALTDYRNGGEA